MKTLGMLAFSLIAIAFSVLGAEDGLVVPVEALTLQHLGKVVLVQTDVKLVPVLGSPPPKGMIIPKTEGVLFKGRLDKIEKDLIIISAFAGTPSDPDYRKPCSIDKRRINEIRILKPNKALQPKAIRVTAPACSGFGSR